MIIIIMTAQVLFLKDSNRRWQDKTKKTKGIKKTWRDSFLEKRKGNKTVSLILRERRVSDPLTQEKQFAVRCVLISVSRQPTENQRRHETSRPKEPDREFNGKHASNKTYDGRSASIEREGSWFYRSSWVTHETTERRLYSLSFPGNHFVKCSALFARLESLLRVVVSSLLYLSSFPEHKVLSFRGGSWVSWRPSLTSLFFSVTQQTFFISNCILSKKRKRQILVASSLSEDIERGRDQEDLVTVKQVQAQEGERCWCHLSLRRSKCNHWRQEEEEYNTRHREETRHLFHHDKRNKIVICNRLREKYIINIHFIWRRKQDWLTPLIHSLLLKGKDHHRERYFLCEDISCLQLI